MKSSDKAIIVDSLVKNYQSIEREKGIMGSIRSVISPNVKTVRALKQISFTLEKGELIGFIGPNGAGKTTTIKILSGLLYPSGGFVSVHGYNPWDRKPDFLKSISTVFGQKNQLWWDLPAQETFELNKAIYELTDREYKESLDELTNLLEVKELLNRQVRKLSLGQRMRLELVAALLHRPNVLFLDEPTIGLDVVAQGKVREFIYEYNKRFHATIILTSHNMDDLVHLVKRVIVIDDGEILFDGDLDELVRQFAKEKIIKVFLSRETDFKRFEQVGTVKEIDYPKVILSVPRQTSAMAAAELLQNFPIADLNIEEESIENIIRRVFKGELRDKS